MTERPSAAARHAGWTLFLLAGVLVAATYHRLLSLPLLGWDSFPLIAAARVEGLGDLWRIATTELMGGRFPDGHFYRPLTALSIALDRALHGLSPGGYHATDLALLAVAGGLLGTVSLRLFGPDRPRAALFAAALLVLHPVQLEVLPAIARRSDLLCLVFLLALIAVQPRAENRSGPGRSLIALVLAFAAAGSKETGLLGGVLVFTLHACAGPGGAGWPVRSAVRRSAPALLGGAAYLATRALVLRGLGGYAESGLPDLTALPGLGMDYLARVLYPQPVLGNAPWVRPLLVAVAIPLAALAPRAAGALRPDRHGPREGFPTLLIWFLTLLAVSSLAGRLFDWYALPFAAPYALLLGLMLDRGWTACAARRFGHGVPLLVLGIPAAGVLLAGSLWFVPYDNLFDAGELHAQSLARLERDAARTADGAVLEMNPWVPLLEPHSDGSEARSLTLYHAYSLQAWFELVQPERAVEVVAWSGHPLEPRPGVLRVLLVPGPRPSWIEHR